MREGVRADMYKEGERKRVMVREKNKREILWERQKERERDRERKRKREMVGERELERGERTKKGDWER